MEFTKITKISEDAAPNFPKAAFDRAFLAATDADPKDDAVREQLIAASYAVVYRHRQAHEAAEALLALLEKSGDQSARERDYEAQKGLFDFFVSLHSSLESTFYALYFAGAQVKPVGFKHAATPESWRDVTSGETLKKFRLAWPKDNLTLALEDLKKTGEYTDLGEARNILAHRIAPRFNHLLTMQGERLANAGDLDHVLRWRGQPVTEAVPQTLTAGEAALASVWKAAAAFFEAPPA
ncbi:hypothetical protein [Streptomyces virginiae]